MTFRTHHTEHVSDMEKPRGKSKTIPDQSLSIQEILARYVNGMPLGIKEHTFIDNDKLIFPDINWEKLDLAEREELMEQAKLEHQELQEKIKNDLKIVQDNRLKKQQEDYNNLQQKILSELRNAEKTPQI